MAESMTTISSRSSESVGPLPPESVRSGSFIQTDDPGVDLENGVGVRNDCLSSDVGAEAAQNREKSKELHRLKRQEFKARHVQMIGIGRANIVYT
jgi:amino acid permease